jgi:hypothetical protein
VFCWAEEAQAAVAAGEGDVGVGDGGVGGGVGGGVVPGCVAVWWLVLVRLVGWMGGWWWWRVRDLGGESR